VDKGMGAISNTALHICWNWSLRIWVSLNECKNTKKKSLKRKSWPSKLYF